MRINRSFFNDKMLASGENNCIAVVISPDWKRSARGRIDGRHSFTQIHISEQRP